MAQTRHFLHNLDLGELSVYVPEEVTPADVEDIEAHFALIVKQCKRRAKPIEGQPQ